MVGHYEHALGVLKELKLYVTLAEKLHNLAVELVADGSGVGSVKMTYTSSRAMVGKGIRINEEQFILDGSSEKPLVTIKVQIANVESCFATAVFKPGEIKVEGIPHLSKVASILGEENLNISSMSVRSITQRNQAVMVIGVNGKPSNEALKKIDEILAVEEFVFLVLYAKRSSLHGDIAVQSVQEL
ncbi:hypothetical protein Tco_1122455 [Tanacetum coccineum]|uniref:ACT domain-containing protein n=1 Tax=Tanacetum coccineum TaxID=301880 RepID=A0ABQ5J208_9ASTR